jgi:hypothetical protein
MHQRWDATPIQMDWGRVAFGKELRAPAAEENQELLFSVPIWRTWAFAVHLERWIDAGAFLVNEQDRIVFGAR